MEGEQWDGMPGGRDDVAGGREVIVEGIESGIDSPGIGGKGGMPVGKLPSAGGLMFGGVESSVLGVGEAGDGPRDALKDPPYEATEFTTFCLFGTGLEI